VPDLWATHLWMISQAELVKKWGYSKGQISKMASRGMPLTSEAEAMSWRVANQKAIGRTSPPLKPNSAPEQGEAQNNGDFSALNTLGRKLRAERMEIASFREMVKAGRQENPIATRASIQTYEKAQKVVRQAEIDYQQEQAYLRQTISISEAKEFITTWFGAIRNLMDAMPSSLSARANPSDPECAKVAIQEGVDQIYMTIQKAEGAFK